MRLGYTSVDEAENRSGIQPHKLFEGFEIDHLITDDIANSTQTRPNRDRIMANLAIGDFFVTPSFRRLAASSADVIRIVEDLRERDVYFVSLEEKINTSDNFGLHRISLLRALRELDRSKRTQKILDSSTDGPRRRGRPCSLTPDEVREIEGLLKDGVQIADLAVRFRCSNRTIYQVWYRRHTYSTPSATGSEEQ